MITANDVFFKKFTEFVAKYNKQYSSLEEFKAKYANFKDNLMSVIASDAFSGKHTKSITKFSDMTPAEFKKQMLTLKVTPNGWCDQMKSHKKTKKNLKRTAAPDTKDWRDEGKVSAIKDQGQCGSCWAFSTVAFMEAQALIQGKALTYSEQQLVDCDTAGVDQGCNGGLMHTAFAYFESKGAEDDTNYPYTASDDTCAYNKKFVIGNVSDIKCAENVSVDDIKEQLNEVGPLAIAVAADDFQMYDSGVLECMYTQLNHGVLLVGYGTENGTDYWIVKNSWGENWGETGFVRVSQADGQNCGIGDYIATATLA